MRPAARLRRFTLAVGGRQCQLGLLLAAVLVGGGIACAPPAPSSPMRTPPPEPTTLPAGRPAPVVVATPVPARLPFAGPTATANVVPLSLGNQVGHSGAGLRIALLLMLQDNAYLGMAALQAAASAHSDDLIAATAALDQNAIALSEIVAAVNGQAAGQQVVDGWRAANADLVQSARGGPVQQDDVRRDLDRQRSSIAAQIAVGEFSSASAQNLLGTRFQQQLSLAEAANARDQQRVLRIARATAASGDDFSRAWAAAIAARQPEQAPPPTEGADIDVRASFARLLEERVYLLGWAEGAAAGGRDAERQAATEAADANAEDVGALIASAYGPDAGSTCGQGLRAEGADLVSAAASGDRDRAVTDLDRVRDQVDATIANANMMLPRGLLKNELRAVDQSLLAAADAFQTHSLTSAYGRVHDAARSSQRAADSLSQGILDRFPGRFLNAD